jgi:transglutaminase-like putative cysteine protease
VTPRSFDASGGPLASGRLSRAVFVTGALLIALGVSVFAVKTLGYGLPMRAADTRGLWQVELRVTVRGDGRQGSVSALLPGPVEGQVVLDERSTSDRLSFSIRAREGIRLGVWQGRFDGMHEIFYQFRVQSRGVALPLPDGPVEAPPPGLAKSYGRASHEFPAGAAEIRDALERLALASVAPVDRVRKIFAFVTHEVATSGTAGSDALLTLAQREGNETGKARLLVTLLRASDVPARLVRGLELRELASPEERVWSEAWLGSAWIPLSPVEGFFAERPANLVPLGDGGRELVEATGAQAVGYRFRSLQERLRPEEMALLMEPENPILAAVSLYKLPVGTQSALRALLLFPLGALLVAIFRNVIGVPTYGTFMPLLVAFSLRGYALAPGLALVAFVLAIGVGTRLALERLRLLMVPRLSIMLCVVVLCVAGFSLIGDKLGARDFFAGVLFPIVILTMLVERFTIAIAEEGLRPAFVPLAGSLAIAIAIHPVFRNLWAEHVMFTFPELTFVVMGGLVWIGGYIGYRISDLLRFRMLSDAQGSNG